MADEQEWSTFADQAFVATTDTFLARTAAGAGVEIAGAHIMARRAAGGPITANGDVTIASNDPVNLNIGSASNTSNHLACINYVNRHNASGQPVTGQIGASIKFGRPSASAVYTITFATTNLTSGSAIDRWVIGATGHLTPAADGATNIGAAGTRVGTVFAATGVINTSDERDKDWGGPISDKEYVAGLEILAELGWYQWKDAVLEKGRDGARLHFGVRAQRVFAILDKHCGEGSWKAYAWACYDAWEAQEEHDPETGDVKVILAAGDRYGLREGQFTMFLMAVQARRMTEMEARIDQTGAN